MNKTEKGYCIFFSFYFVASICLYLWYSESFFYTAQLDRIGYFLWSILWFILIRDIYKRDQSPKSKVLWTTLVLFLFPTIIIYLWRHGFRTRKEAVGISNRTRFFMAIPVILFLLIILFCTQTVFIFLSKKMCREYPGLYATPEPLELPKELSLKGTMFSYFGYQFEVPWDKIKCESKNDNACAVSFESGKFFLVFSPANQQDLVKMIREENPYQAGLFGKESLKSNYAFLSAQLHASPNSLSILKPKRIVSRTYWLLHYKLPYAYKDSRGGGLFSFEHGTIRGFQIGLPQASCRFKLEFFDEEDQHVSMVVTCNSEQETLAQEEINHIIMTFRPIGNE